MSLNFKFVKKTKLININNYFINFKNGLKIDLSKGNLQKNHNRPKNTRKSCTFINLML